MKIQCSSANLVHNLLRNLLDFSQLLVSPGFRQGDPKKLVDRKEERQTLCRCREKFCGSERLQWLRNPYNPHPWPPEATADTVPELGF